jgi:HAD superfamily hydrolase (TIGR01549 family)
MSSAVRAVIFDLGGTLLEFNPQHQPWMEWEREGLDAAHAYLSACGHGLPRAELMERFFSALNERWDRATKGGANLRLQDLLSESYAACGFILTADEIAEAVARYIAPIDARVVAFDDAVATLDVLRRQGHKIGLISNTMWPGEFHRQEMARSRLLPYFDHALFSSDVGIWKPQPGIYHLCLDALGVSPAEAVFVGDMPEHDIVGAQRAGMRGILKRNDGNQPGAVRPDAEIVQLSELPALIERW